MNKKRKNEITKWLNDEFEGIIELFESHTLEEFGSETDEIISIWLRPLELEDFATILKIDYESEVDCSIVNDGEIYINLAHRVLDILEISYSEFIEYFKVGE